MTPVKLASIKFANAVKCGPHHESEYMHSDTHQLKIDLYGMWVRVECKKSGEIAWSSLLNTINVTPVDKSIILGATNETQGRKVQSKGKSQSKAPDAIQQAAEAL